MPSKRKEAVRALSKLGASERAASRLVDCSRATIKDISRREPNDPAVIDSMRKIASQRLRLIDVACIS